MAKSLITSLFLLMSTSITLLAQEKTVGYFNSLWRPVEKADATYYRTVENQPDGRFLVKDYYMSGQLQMQPVVCTAYTPKLMWEGNTILYHENGQIKEEGFFKNEARLGVHKYWYDNGSVMKTVWHGEDGKEKYHQYWSATGKEFLSMGTGTVEEIMDSGNKTYKDFRDSIWVSSYTYYESIGDTVFLMVDSPPEYRGGQEEFNKTIFTNIKYPVTARRKGIQGVVYIGFVVDENGKGMAHEVIKGISSDCDQEALRVVKLANDWKPGSHRGRPVKVKFVYPIKYKLD